MKPEASQMTNALAAELIAAHTREVASPVCCGAPRLSVALMTYNHARFIREALDGVFMQETDFPIEVVIGDDCSTDGTTEIVLEYQRRYPEMTRVLLARENLGARTGNGRLNLVRALRACRGEFVALLEGDDYWTAPGKLQIQVDAIDVDPECAGCFHETSVVFDDDSESTHRVYGRTGRSHLDAADTFSLTSPFHTSSFVFRRSALDLPEWFLHVVSADMALFSIVAASGRLAKVTGVLSAYRKHPGGITANVELEQLRVGWRGRGNLGKSRFAH